MIHPMFGNIEIKDVRQIEGYTLAYFNKTLCNMNILKEISKEVENAQNNS